MIQDVIQKLIDKEDLDRQTATAVMNQIMSGEATDAQIGAFLIALRCKGESVDEVAGFAAVMREKATRISGGSEPLVDTCGTGGDGSGSFNISTTVAFVAAGAGLSVAKHGNRAMSSQCGSADVLQALGVNVEIGPEQVGACMDEAGIGFLFAPMLHSAMKHAIGPRKEIGTRTVFNVLGPLTNPAGARRQLLGVFEKSLTEKLAGVLRALGSERAFVVHGNDGLDEITITGPTTVTELANGDLSTFEISPLDVGFETAPAAELRGGDAAENAKILTGVLEGNAGPRKDVVVVNAAAAIAAGGLAATIADGISLAEESISSGKALGALEKLREVSNR